MNFFLREGRFKSWVELLIGIVGVAVVLLTIQLATQKWLFIIGVLFGVCLIAVSSVSAKATTFGLKPFTNDPLGWRAAKKTYESDAPSIEPTKPEDVSKP
jgi:uncharacterized membrane protein